MNKLTKKEKDKLNIKGKFDTLFIHDIENTIGYKRPDHGQKSYFFNLLRKLDKELGVKDNDLVVIAGNKKLIEKANNIYYEDTPCKEIIFPAGGKDGADLKLLASVQRLYSSNQLSQFKKVVIVSGDNIFSSWARTLTLLVINVETISLRENTCREFRISNSHKYLKNLFEESSKELSYA